MKFYRLSDATFFYCINNIFQFIKLFLDKKCLFLYPAPRYWRGVMASRWVFMCLSVHLSVVHPYACISYLCISFPDDNLSKHLWVFNKLGMCIDIVEIWFGIFNGQISLMFDRVICCDTIKWRGIIVNVFIEACGAFNCQSVR